MQAIRLVDSGDHQVSGNLALEKFPGELQQLRSQSHHMQQVLELMPSGLVTLNGDGLIVQTNAAADDLLGLSLLGQSWGQVVNTAFSPKADDGHELSLTNGKRIKLSLFALGEQPGQLIIMTDLTQTRQLQTRLAQMQRLSALGKMVASLAHQIRTPLASALLYGGNLLNRNLPDSAKNRFATKLMARLNDLETQVNDMLLFAKSGDNQIVEQLSMQALLTKVQEHSHSLVERDNCSLEMQLPEPDLIILANASALISAIGNLIDNAVKAYGSDTTAQKIITVKAQLNANNEVCISVSDRGPGIAPELHGKIIEPFYTTRTQGTGLGLAVVHAVAKAHDGYLGLESSPGQGSKFKIILPLTAIATHSQCAGGA